MRRRAAIALTPLLLLPLTAMLLGFSRTPLPGLTGGFQEPTCQSCHVSFALNEGHSRGGTFYISGVPQTYRPGESYPLSVVIGQPGQRRWGFQLTSRFRSTGEQAGELIPADDRSLILEAGGIQYLQHADAGPERDRQHGPVEFRFTWVAPRQAGSTVQFNAAGNAADGNEEETGDFVYTAGAFSGPPEGIETPDLPQLPRVPVRRISSSPRLINLPAPVPTRKGDWEVYIEHRFLRSIRDAGPGNAFGIDSGANIQLGLAYALNDRLRVGVSRARFDRIVTWSAGYGFRDRPEDPFHFSLYGGVEGKANFRRQYSPFLQLAAAQHFGRLRTYVVPTVVFNSRDDRMLELLEPIALNPRDNHTFSLGLGGDFALNRRLSLSGEAVPRMAGFGGFGRDHTSLSGAFNIRTFGHVFSITVSNSREFTPSRYGVNADSDDFVLGFNIYRRR